MALELDFHNNFDRLKDAQSAEEISPALTAREAYNLDKIGYEVIEAEIIGVERFATSTIIDKLSSRIAVYETIAVVPQPAVNSRDTFQTLANQAEDSLESNEVEWAFGTLGVSEITDAIKSLPILLRPNISANVSVEYEVLNTSTAQNIQEYLLDGNGQGTLTFGTVSGAQEFVKTLTFEALTQVLARPARTVNVRLKNAVGSGTFWPRFVIQTTPVNGESVFIFGQGTWYFGSQIPLGTSPADQAQKIAAYWNGLNPTFNGTWKALAVAVGNSVEFQIDTALATQDSGMNNYYTQFYSNTAKIVTKGNMNGNYYVHIGHVGNPLNERRDSWTAVVGDVSTLVVTIAAHGARPGQISVFSYNQATKRAAKRAQLPNTMVSGLKEKLDELSQRLKNRGF